MRAALLALCCAGVAHAAVGPDAGSSPAADGGQGLTAPQASSLAAADAGPLSIAMLQFEANKEALEQAGPVTALVASDLSRAPQLKVLTQSDVTAAIGLQRQKALLGGQCDENCLVEISGALGAQYVLSGRVDAFGGRYVLTASLFDSRNARNVAKPRAEAVVTADLPDAARSLATQVFGALGVPAPAVAPSAQALAGAASGPTLSLKVGSAFFEGLKSFNLAGTLEIGYRFLPDWIACLQIGFSIVTSKIDSGGVTVVPGLLGVRHLYRINADLQPYWGLGLGVQLSFGKFGPISSTTSGALPAVVGMLGFEYLVTQHFAVGLELSTDISEAVLGIANNTESSGFNLNLVGILSWRF